MSGNDKPQPADKSLGGQAQTFLGHLYRGKVCPVCASTEWVFAPAADNRMFPVQIMTEASSPNMLPFMVVYAECVKCGLQQQHSARVLFHWIEANGGWDD